jgi:hypothetical protein
MQLKVFTLDVTDETRDAETALSALDRMGLKGSDSVAEAATQMDETGHTHLAFVDPIRRALGGYSIIEAKANVEIIDLGRSGVSTLKGAVMIAKLALLAVHGATDPLPIIANAWSLLYRMREGRS